MTTPCCSFSITTFLSLLLPTWAWLLLFLRFILVFGDGDGSVLLEFKSAVLDSAGLLSTWASVNSSSQYCEWSGISCDSNFRVVSLNITGGTLRPSCGEFPFYRFGFVRRSCEGGGGGGSLAGKLPRVLGKLIELKVLSLPFNDFDGEIPDDIWELRKLEVIDLEGNQVTGSLPVRMSPSLRVVNLGFNRIEGEIPIPDLSSMRLEMLNLAANRVNGSVPGYVGRLKGVCLLNNWLSGDIPSEIGENCGSLEHLDLSGNFLVHKIPASLGNCSKLRALLLYSNMLEEGVPAELGRLQRLEVLDVSRNSLSGLLPKELGNCSELSVLVLSSLFNPLPVVRGNYTDEPLLEKLSSMNDDFNYFQGSMPKGITSLPKLKILWAPRASIEGSFPKDWGACENLEMINLALNFFNGEISSALNRCQKLHFLDLSSNKLTGNLDQVLQVSCITLFDVSDNLLSGSVPEYANSTCEPMFPVDVSFNDDDLSSHYEAFFGSQARAGIPLLWQSEDDVVVVIHNFGHNNFSGNLQSLPVAPGRFQKKILYAFLVGENKLTGTLLGNIFGKCQRLHSLVVNVSNNRLDGEIPVEIGYMCMSLKILDTSGNQITGSIPASFGSLVSLAGLNLSSNMLHGQIPNTIGHMRDLKHLSLSSNNLTGDISASLGELYSLHVLELSRNHLYGKIPSAIGNMSWLETLDLAHNHLLEEIPQSLFSLKLLSHMDLSYNNLSGRIPSSRQLQTPTDSHIYEGNPLLCGFPLPTKCPGDIEKPTSSGDLPVQDNNEDLHVEDNDEDDNEKLGLYISTVLGFITGLWGVLGTLLVKKSWRYALFGSIDILTEKIVVACAVKLARLQGRSLLIR